MSEPILQLLEITQRLPGWLAISILSLATILALTLIAATLLPLWQRLTRASAHHSKQQQHRLRLLLGLATIMAMTAPYLIASTPWLATMLLIGLSAIGWLARHELQPEQEQQENH